MQAYSNSNQPRTWPGRRSAAALAALPKTGVGTLSSLALVTILAAASPGNAGPPPNDQCANRTPIFLGDTPFDATGASTDGTPGCSSGVDIWYNFTADSTGTLRIAIDDFGAALGVYDGCGCPAEPANLLGCALLVSPLEIATVAGNCYKMQLTAFLGPGIGILSLSLTVPTGACCLSEGLCVDGLLEPECVGVGGVFQGQGTACESIDCGPANDDCENAIEVFSGDSIAGDLNGATNDGSPSCGSSSANADVWYTFTAPASGTLRANTCGTHDSPSQDEGMDTVLSVHSGCPGTVDNELDCNDDWPFGSDPSGCEGADIGSLVDSAVAVGLTAGQTVTIRVSHFGNDLADGLFVLNVEFGLPSDDCSDALAIFNGETPFTNVGATTDGPSPCGVLGSDVWFNYDADFNGNLVVETCGSGFDTVLAVYSGCDCPADEVNLLACNDDAEAPSACARSVQSSLTVEVVPGECYKVQVGGFKAQEGEGIITIEKVFPVGACCLAGGSCLDLTEADCAAQSGAFQGGDTSCSGSYVIEECDNPFEDISGTGTELVLGDDAGEVVSIGFEFAFFSVFRTAVGVTSNGYLTFGDDLSDFTNDPIPDATDPNDSIFPFWDDLDPTEGGSIHHQTLGDPGERRFIAQWTGVPEFNLIGTNTFQAILFEGTNCIEFRYGTFSADLSGSDVTIGVENPDGSVGSAVDTATISPGSCVQLCPVALSCVCPWDLNGDATVNVSDLIELLLSFGPCQGCPADFDNNGSVNVLDLIEILLNFGPCPALVAPCPWDVTVDGVVDEADYQSLLSNLGPCPTDPEPCPWDFNGDGVVDFTDAQEMLVNFGPCP